MEPFELFPDNIYYMAFSEVQFTIGKKEVLFRTPYIELSLMFIPQTDYPGMVSVLITEAGKDFVCKIYELQLDEILTLSELTGGEVEFEHFVHDPRFKVNQITNNSITLGLVTYSLN